MTEIGVFNPTLNGENRPTLTMTMELFSLCLAKCTKWGLYKLFERLLDEYPDLTDKYVKAIEDDIKDVILPERTPEEEEESWNRLCERIKNEYGDDLISE